MSYIGNQPISTAFVTDTFSGDGSTVAFTMSVAPASTTSVLVAITGVLQDPSTYSVVGTTLTFTAAPPSGTGNISVRYLGIPASGVTTTAYRTVTNFTATAGQTTFTPPSYTVGYIDVYRNGSKLALADFTATNGTTVVLAAGCNAGDVVETDSFYVSSVLNAIPATAGAVNSTYIAAGAVGSTALASGAALANIGSGGITQTYLATGVSGTGPAFHAYGSGSQVISSGSQTTVQFTGTLFDTNSCFNTSTYRFTPTVAGYYQFNLSICVSATITNSEVFAYVVKNSSGYLMFDQGGSPWYSASGSVILYANGTTDYFTAQFYQNSGSNRTISGSTATMFSGALVRAA